MSTGTALSLFINILVGAYLLWLYPRSVKKSFARGRTPPLFVVLSRVLPVLGAALMAGSVLYALFALAGSTAT